MAPPLPGMGLLRGQRGHAPSSGRGQALQALARTKAALTFFDNQAVFVILAEDAVGNAQLLRFARRKPAPGTQTS